MATQLQIRRGTTSQMNAFTGAEGELAVNTTTDTVHVHDGSTAGGHALAKADGSNIAAYAGSFTTISASGTITGNVTGNITGSVLTAAQTNITSLGTLSALTVSGDLDVDGTANLDVVDIDGAVDMATTLTVAGLATVSEMTVSDTDDIRLRFLNGTTFKAGLQVATSTGDMIAGSAVDDLAVRSQANMLFSTGGNTERMRIDGATGGLLVGTTSLAVSTSTGSVTGAVINTTGLFEAAKTGTVMELNRLTADGTILNVRRDGTSVGSVGVINGNNFTVGGAVASHAGLQFGTENVTPMVAGSEADGGADLGASNLRWRNLYLSGFVRAGAGTAADPVLTGSDGNTGFFFPSGGVTCFTQNGVERGRFDASGNFLVGRTSVGSTGNGHSIRGGDSAIFSRDSTGESCIIARNNTPGPALRFNSNGSNIGGIGTHSAGGTELYMGNGSNIGFRFEQTGADRIEPCVGLGQSGRNNAIDLGISGNQWRSIYCETVFESSDRTLKQDIEALSDAEQRVAIAAKSLLRKYRLISDVEKEDNRYSFGIIAQDLQAAFAAEGLDAANYKMWKEATFTDETTGEEKTQQSIVYSQLLAFIIAAI